jgi:hypothetical protein
MPYGDGGDFFLNIMNCRSWRNLNDLVDVLESIQNEFGISAVSLTTGIPTIVWPQDFAEYCQAAYETREGGWDENYYFMQADGGLTLKFLLPFLREDTKAANIYLTMNSNKFGEEYNGISFYVRMSQIDHTSGLIQRYGPPTMDLLSKLGLYLSGQLSPDYLATAEDDEKYQRVIEPKHILEKQVKYIYWTNYYGPEFLTPAAKDVFLNALIGTATITPDGGLWYRLYEDFMGLSDREVLAVEKQAMEYFGKHFDVKWIQWRFSPA